MMGTIGNAMLGGVQGYMQQTGESPARVLGRVLGMGSEEMAVGVPKWAWAGVGFVAGATTMWVFRDQIRRAVGRS